MSSAVTNHGVWQFREEPLVVIRNTIPLIAFFWVGLPACFGFGPNADLPFDPAVRMGHLENGLRYYIRQNDNPKGSAELRLLINVGSLQEDDDQLGYAHLVEHMGFNGTECFPGQDLLEYLQSLGIRMGSGLNAYTSYDDTYFQLRVPTGLAGELDEAVFILSEWAGGISFSQNELKKEIPVILEEGKLHRGPRSRLSKKWRSVLLDGSRYLERPTIGTPHSIINANLTRLEQFYREWYRPQLMAVIAVGDFDPIELEQLIHLYFGPMKPGNGRPRRQWQIPYHQDVRFGFAGDPESTESFVSIYFKGPAYKIKTIADYRQHLVEEVFFQLMNERLLIRAEQPDPPYLKGMAHRGDFVRSLGGFVLYAEVEPTGFETGLMAILEEFERVKSYGFCPEELAQQKKIMAQKHAKVSQKDWSPKTRSLVKRYQNHFLKEEPLMSRPQTAQLVRELLPQIGIEEINGFARVRFPYQNTTVLGVGYERDPPPKAVQSSFRNTFRLGLEQTPAALPCDQGSSSLQWEPMAPGKVVEEKLDPDFVTRWVFANGLKVIFKKSHFNKRVSAHLFSPGGRSLAEKDEWVVAEVASDLADTCESESFPQGQLRRFMRTRDLQVRSYFSHQEHGVFGSSPREHVRDLLFRLMVYFKNHSLEERNFEAFRVKQFLQWDQNRFKPMHVFRDQLEKDLFPDRMRRNIPAREDYSKLTLKAARNFLAACFGDPSNFTLILSGNLEAHETLEYLRGSLGAIESGRPSNVVVGLGERPFSGNKDVSIYSGQEPQSVYGIVFQGTYDGSLLGRFQLEWVCIGLKMVLRAKLREEHGLIYQLWVEPEFHGRSGSHFQVRIYFKTSPEKLKRSKEVLQSCLSTLQKNGFAAEEVTNLFHIAKTEYQLGLETHAFWLDHFHRLSRAGSEAMVDLYPNWLANLTHDPINRTLRTALETRNVYRLTLMPEPKN